MTKNFQIFVRYMKFKEDLEKIFRIVKKNWPTWPNLINQILKKWASVLNHHLYQLMVIMFSLRKVWKIYKSKYVIPQILELQHYIALKLGVGGTNVILLIVCFTAMLLFIMAIPIFMDSENSFCLDEEKLENI